MPSITGAHHAGLTVTDAERSAQWYSDLLGLIVLMSADEDDVRLRVLMHPGSGWIMGVREYPKEPKDRFSELRTGLDHFAFTVETREELDAWEQELDQRGITYSPINETPIGTVIAFRDPDNIQLELWLPIG
jgi:glyoxylase I family protein